MNIKSILSLFIILLGLTVSNAQNASLPVLICNSVDEVQNYSDDSLGSISFSGYVENEYSLIKAKMKGVYDSNVTDLIGSVRFKESEFIVFPNLVSEFNWFDLLVPQGFNLLEGSFAAYIEINGSDLSVPESVEMSCFIKW